MKSWQIFTGHPDKDNYNIIGPSTIYDGSEYKCVVEMSEYNKLKEQLAELKALYEPETTAHKVSDPAVIGLAHKAFVDWLQQEKILGDDK